MTSTQRITRGFSIEEDGQDAERTPRRIRTRQQIIAGEGKRPPAAVALSELAHNPFNPREELTDIAETAMSLRQRGQLQPIAVVRASAFLAVHGDQAEHVGAAEYVVIDGNRRLAAAHEAGLVELRIDVNDDLATSAADLLESALIANIHRVDVAPVDQAKAIKELLEVHGTQVKVAQRLGKTEGWLSQRLALLNLAEDLQEKVESGELKVRDGRRIGRLPADQQHSEAEQAINAAKSPRKPRKRVSAEAEGDADDTVAARANTLPSQDKGEHDAGATLSEGLYPVKTEETSTGAVNGQVPGEGHLVGTCKHPRMPWHDGNAVADLIFEKMGEEQRQVLLERVFSEMGDEQREVVLERLLAIPSAT